MSSTTLIPTFEEAALAQASTRALDGISLAGRDRLRLETEGRAVELPAKLFGLLQNALESMARGQAVSLISLEEEITPQEAAVLLNVSRPFAARLFDQGIIPSRRVGTHRRALASDVMAYREREKTARLRVLDDLTAEAQRLGL
jgi:excisionase family DNA binding protein